MMPTKNKRKLKKRKRKNRNKKSIKSRKSLVLQIFKANLTPSFKRKVHSKSSAPNLPKNAMLALNL
jgi:hypothetical protein